MAIRTLVPLSLPRSEMNDRWSLPSESCIVQAAIVSMSRTFPTALESFFEARRIAWCAASCLSFLGRTEYVVLSLAIAFLRAAVVGESPDFRNSCETGVDCRDVPVEGLCELLSVEMRVAVISGG